MKKIYLFILTLLAVLGCSKPTTTTQCNVLPLPQQVELNSKVFTLSNTTKFEVEAPESDKKILEEYL
jgi:uncharacterized protein YcfL